MHVSCSLAIIRRRMDTGKFCMRRSCYHSPVEARGETSTCEVVAIARSHPPFLQNMVLSLPVCTWYRQSQHLDACRIWHTPCIRVCRVFPADRSESVYYSSRRMEPGAGHLHPLMASSHHSKLASECSRQLAAASCPPLQAKPTYIYWHKATRINIANPTCEPSFTGSMTVHPFLSGSCPAAVVLRDPSNAC